MCCNACQRHRWMPLPWKYEYVQNIISTYLFIPYGQLMLIDKFRECRTIIKNNNPLMILQTQLIYFQQNVSFRSSNVRFFSMLPRSLSFSAARCILFVLTMRWCDLLIALIWLLFSYRHLNSISVTKKVKWRSLVLLLIIGSFQMNS